MTDDNVAAAEISKWKLDFVVVLFLFIWGFFVVVFLEETNFLRAEKCHSALIKGRQALLNISLQLSKMKSFFLFLFFFSSLRAALMWTCRFKRRWLAWQAAVTQMRKQPKVGWNVLLRSFLHSLCRNLAAWQWLALWWDPPKASYDDDDALSKLRHLLPGAQTKTLPKKKKKLKKKTCLELKH